MARVTRRKLKKRISRKYRQKRQKGGVLSENERAMLLYLKTHEYIRSINPLKPIATPNSGGDFLKALELWNKLSDQEKNSVSTKFLKHFNSTLGVHISGKIGRGQNSIIFYGKEFLDILAQSSGLSVEELLDIISEFRPNTPPFNMDLITIAFGSFELNGLHTNEGKEVFEKYKTELKKQRYMV